MRSLSTVVLLLAAGCVHLGVAPPVSSFATVEVAAPVAEPEVGERVADAVRGELGARAALGGEGVVRLTVLSATSSPAGRSGERELYRATLRVRVEVDGRSNVFEVTRDAADPGSAAVAVAARATLFAGLAEEVAPAIAAWLAGS